MSPRCTVLFLLLTPLVAQARPKVVELSPANRAVEVDARTRQLVVVFDQPMNRRGHSICGGGPQFPEFAARPKWKNDKTLVLSVVLKPDHTYRMSLNCSSARNFRSKKGVALAPTPWTFSTLPEKLRPEKEQRERNRASLAVLKETLAAKYSYYEHCKIDWETTWTRHAPGILSARTDRGWAMAVARMLAKANDLHMYLRVRGETIGTGRRAVDPLYREQLLGKYLGATSQPGRGLLAARTADGIAYLMISGWTQHIDFDGVEEWIRAARDAKAERRVEGLIIDVRPNSGGGENLARRVAQWFVAGTKTYARHATRKGPGEKNFFPVSRRRIRGKPEGERFRRPVVVLMSRYCMSSCEAFLLMMKQAEQCTLVGQRSYGSSGNPKSHDLPNAVQIVLPSWKAMRADGSVFEGVGIAPDVEVAATGADFEKRDPFLERALQILRR